MLTCPGCGFEAPDDFAFCPRCATKLAAPLAIPEERKVVTWSSALVDSDRLDGRVCATTVTTVDYLATRALGGRQAKKLVRQVLDLFGVTAVDGRVLEAALRLDFADFEDAVVHGAARACGAAAS